MFGFNLDNHRSPVTRPPEGPPHCAHGDYASAMDQDQNGDFNDRPCAAGAAGCVGGVDNQLPALVDAFRQFPSVADPRRLITERINSGALILLVRISEVNGPLGPTLCDDDVTVRLYLGYPLFWNCANIHIPDQQYAIAASSVLNPSDPTSARFQRRGAIVNGRLRVTRQADTAELPYLSIPLPLSAFRDVPLDLYNPQLRATLVPGGSVTDGNLGGFVYAQDLATSLRSEPAFAAILDRLLPFVSGFADIATPLGGPDDRCSGTDGGGRIQGAIGLGYGFTMTPASVINQVMSARMAGTCGYAVRGPHE